MWLITESPKRAVEENAKWALSCYFELFGRKYSNYSSYLNYSSYPMFMDRFLVDAELYDNPKLFDTKDEAIQWMKEIKNDLLKIKSMNDENIADDKASILAYQTMKEYLSKYSVRSVMFILALYDGKLSIEYHEDTLKVFSNNEKIYIKFAPCLIYKYKRKES